MWGADPARACGLSRCAFGLEETVYANMGGVLPGESQNLGEKACFLSPPGPRPARRENRGPRGHPGRSDPSPPTDVIHTVGPIAHGEPSASQAAELRSCYLNSLDLLLEHRLRSAVRGVWCLAAGAAGGRGRQAGGRGRGGE